MTISGRPAAIFCDFDGTVTEEDLIIQVWRRFARDGWQEKVREMLDRRVSLKTGVPEIFAEIPSSLKEEIIEHAKGVVRFRAGFPEFLAFCREHGIPFNLVSGGIDFFVDPVIEPFRSLMDEVYTIPADLSGPTIRLQHPYPCESCGLCKARVLALHPPGFRILIGDSVTDLHGALEADLVFARGRLQTMMREHGHPFEPFETFFDVRAALEEKYLAPRRGAASPEAAL